MAKATILRKAYQARHVPDRAAFADRINGKKTELFVLKNKHGMQVAITNYGARLVSVLVPDNKGKLTSVVLGFDSLQKYVHAKAPYYGATIGRYANRIGGGNLVIGDTTYLLSKNSNGNTNHGGFNGFNNKVWRIVSIKKNAVKFSYFSIDLEEGFPGNVYVSVTYRLSQKNELTILYHATTDKETVINLTNHAFFNLNGEGSPTIGNHILQINADTFTPLNEKQLPTGEIRGVSHTVFDFREPKAIDSSINLKDEQLTLAGGFDHNYVLNKANEKGLTFASKITSPQTGITLKVFTDQPGMQFFTANAFKGLDKGRTGKPIIYRSAFCLETQHFPDAPHHPDFPSTILKPTESYRSVSNYQFSRSKIH